METWKIIAITGLVAALPLYGYISNSGTKPPSPNQPAGTPAPTGPPPLVRKLVGKAAPPWQIAPGDWANTPKPIKLEELRGQIVLLEFWRAECSHCQEAAPYMEKLAEEYKSRGLRVIGLHSPVQKTGIDEFNWTAVQQKAKELGIKYPIGLDTGRKNFNLYKGEKFPTLVLIDRNGIVRYADNGFLPGKLDALIRAIDRLLKESPATAEKPPAQ